MQEHNNDDWVILCPACDLAVRRRALPSNVRALCPRCHTALYDTPYVSINGMLAICIAAIILFIPANLLPVLELHFLGSVRTATVIDGAIAVIQLDYWVVGLAVLVAAVIGPGILLISILTQLLLVKAGIASRWQKSLYTWLLKHHTLVSQLTMLEIYLISFLVSAFQLSDFSDVYFGVGTFCFTMLFLVTLFLQREYSIEHMWSYLNE